MGFFELIRERYSVRSFKAEMFEEEKLSAILEAGRVAPTAKNNQPQRVYVVKSEAALAAVREHCRCTFGAPVVLVIGYDTQRDCISTLVEGVRFGETDAAIVTTHMMLAAWELGIGSCWVGYFKPEGLHRELGIPDTVHITALLPLGYAADDAAPSERHTMYRDFDDTVTVL